MSYLSHNWPTSLISRIPYSKSMIFIIQIRIEISISIGCIVLVRISNSKLLKKIHWNSVIPDPSIYSPNRISSHWIIQIPSQDLTIISGFEFPSL